MDVPGVYEIGAIRTSGLDDCLRVSVADVRLVSAPGAGQGLLASDGNGTAIAVVGTATGDAAAVANLSIGGLTVDGFATGLRLSTAQAARVTDVTVRNGTRAGVEAADMDRVTLRNVAVTDGAGVALAIPGTRTVTVDGFTAATVSDLVVTLFGQPVTLSTGTAVQFGSNDDVSIADVEVRNTARALDVVGPAVGSVTDVRTDGVEELLVTVGPSPGLSVSGVTYPDATTGETRTVALAGFGGTAAVGGPVPTDAPPADRPVYLGALTVTGQTTGHGATVTFPVDSTAVDPATVGVYRLDRAAGGWVDLGAALGGGNDSVTASVSVGADGGAPESAVVAVFAAQRTENGSAPGSSPGPEPTPAPNACPAVGASGQTGDLDGDGLCEDVDGDGRFDFVDVIDLVFVDPGRLTTADVPGLDFNGDGQFDFVDVIDLVFRL